MGYKKVVAAFYRGVLSARYRVRLEGAGLLTERRATLFLPNHQASVDPQIVCSQLLRYVDVSPLVTEGYFKIPVVAQVLHLMNAVRVPDLEKSRRGVEIVAGLNRVVVDALAAGHNVLLYPAGQLTSSGLERVGNKQGAWQVCHQLPEGTRVVSMLRRVGVRSICDRVLVHKSNLCSCIRIQCKCWLMFFRMDINRLPCSGVSRTNDVLPSIILCGVLGEWRSLKTRPRDVLLE